MKRGIKGARTIHDGETLLSMKQASELLGVSRYILRKLVEAENLPATQIVQRAPWLIRRADLDLPEVKKAIELHRAGKAVPCKQSREAPNPVLPGIYERDI